MPIEARRQGREEPVRASSGDDKECGEARHAASSGRAASLDGHGVKFCLPLPYNSPTRGRKTRCMAFGPFEEPVVEHRVRRLVLEVGWPIVETVSSTALLSLGWMPGKLKAQFAVDVVTLCFQLS